MEMTFDIPGYNQEEGLPFHWEDGFEIEVKESKRANIDLCE